MELVYTLKGLDCPHCSAKIESEIGAKEGILSATVNLMQQSLTISTELAAEAVHALVRETVKKHEPDVEVIPRQGRAVQRVYHLEGLDCPHCSAKIESAVQQMPAVREATVDLLTQTLTVQAETALHLHDIEAIVHKYEPDVAVTEQRGGHHAAHDHAHGHHHAHGESCCCDHEHEHEHEHEHCCDHEHEHEHEHEHCCDHEHEREHEHEHEHEHDHAAGNDKNRKMVVRLAVGAGVFLVGMILHIAHAPSLAVLCVMLAAYAVLGWDVVWTALRNITRGQVFDEHFLMSVSTVGAFCLGEYPEAAAVMLFYQVGEFFQSLAVQRSRRSVAALLDIRPDTANVLQGSDLLTVDADEVEVGERILIKAGERVPLDGVVLEGASDLDTSALTGESVPRRIAAGDSVLSGCINGSGTLTVEVTKPFGESTASKMIEMVEHAAARKAPAEQFITKFARWYTPIVVVLAALLAVIPPLVLGGGWADWLRRAFVFLIVSCPCALVISVPLTFFGGIGAASRRGVLVKGSNYLEALSKVSEMVFDKTGTLTEGRFRVTEILPADGVSEETLLAAAASLEKRSDHPIAKSVLAAYQGDAVPADDLMNYAGKGLGGSVGGKETLAGNAALMEQFGIAFPVCGKSGTKVYVAQGGRYIGCIVIADALKLDSADAIAALREAGIRRLTMLTGDNEPTAQAVSAELGLDAYYAELLPADKVSQLEKLEDALPADESLAYVGDGINDAPVLARADVGIAMGALGSDAAIEAADVVLMHDEPMRLADAIQVARKTKRIVTENIVFAIGVKVLILLLGAAGIVGMWAAVFGDVGVTVIAVLNAMRMLRKES